MIITIVKDWEKPNHKADNNKDNMEISKETAKANIDKKSQPPRFPTTRATTSSP